MAWGEAVGGLVPGETPPVVAARLASERATSDYLSNPTTGNLERLRSTFAYYREVKS